MVQNNEELFLENLKKMNLQKKQEKATNNNDSENNKAQEQKKDNAFKKLKELTQNQKKWILNINETKKEHSKNIAKKEDIKSVKNDEKLISYKGVTDENDLLKKKKWEDSYEDVPFEEIVPLERKDLIKINEFEWEREHSISKPKKEDFQSQENENKKLGWLKEEINKKNNDISIKKTKEDYFFPWESTQKISAPTKEDFIDEINEEKAQVDKTSEDFSKQITEFEWEKKDPIEKPLYSDFYDEKNKEFVKTPKWIHKNDILNEIPKNNDYVESDKKIINHPRWIHKDNMKTEEMPPNKNQQEKIKNIQKIENDSKDDSKKNKIDTPIDIIFEMLEEYKTVNMGHASSVGKIDYYSLEKIMKVFEEYGIINISYPTSISKKPNINLLQKISSKIIKLPQGELINEYEIIVDKVPAQIRIVSTKNEARPVYGITMPAVGTYTRKFLNFIKNEIAETVMIDIEDITNPKKTTILKKRFFSESKKHLSIYFTNLKEETLDILSGIILHDMYGLGDIEIFLGDDMLEEVAINSSKTPLTVYHRIHGWIKTNFYPGTEDEISNYSAQIGRKVGREITTLSPILDAHLLSGDRVNATLFPISSEGNTLTIRRFARRPWTIVDFIGKAHTMNIEMAALLWLAMQYEMNILVSGGTASGKTSTLNTLLALVPSYHRIISIEDVREIVLPKFLKWNWVPMVTRSANPEGLGEITMLDCMVSSLRMRPDRIIVGEIRRKKEAEVMMEAIETGHSIYSTIHANSAYQVLRRLGEAPMSIPPMQIELIDLVVTQFRDRKTNKRRTYEIAEIEQTSSGKGLQINTIYKWVPRTDKWDNLNKPIKLLTLLNMHTGLTESEIESDLKEREKILSWLIEKNINDIEEIGFIIKKFYINKKEVINMAEKKITKEEINEMMK